MQTVRGVLGTQLRAPSACPNIILRTILLHKASLRVPQRPAQSVPSLALVHPDSGALQRQQRWRCSTASQDEAKTETTTEEPSAEDPTVSVSSIDLNKEVSKFARNTASTFAPRASGPSKNPAYKGSTLYTVFEVQSYISIAIGALLSFNVIFPSDKPDIARLIGMWSVWMFAIPSLRARDCSKDEKDALNLLFLLVPLINVLLPFVWKSFPFIFSADVVALVGIYAWKVWLPNTQEQEQ